MDKEAFLIDAEHFWQDFGVEPSAGWQSRLAEHFFATDRLREAIDVIRHLSRYSSVVICVKGTSGSGKTRLLQHITRQASADDHVFALDSNPQFDIKKLIAAINNRFNFDPIDGETSNTKQLDHQLDRAKRMAMHAVILVDSAETLPQATIDALFYLSKKHTHGEHGIRAVLFCNNRIDPKLQVLSEQYKQDDLFYTIHLPAFTAAETKQYILSRLKIVGFSRVPLSDTQFRNIHHKSSGNAAAINNLLLKELLVSREGTNQSIIVFKTNQVAVVIIAAAVVVIFLIIMLMGYAFSDDDGKKAGAKLAQIEKANLQKNVVDNMSERNIDDAVIAEINTDIDSSAKPVVKSDHDEAELPDAAEMNYVTQLSPQPNLTTMLSHRATDIITEKKKTAESQRPLIRPNFSYTLHMLYPFAMKNKPADRAHQYAIHERLSDEDLKSARAMQKSWLVSLRGYIEPRYVATQSYVNAANKTLYQRQIDFQRFNQVTHAELLARKYSTPVVMRNESDQSAQLADAKPAKIEQAKSPKSSGIITGATADQFILQLKPNALTMQLATDTQQRLVQATVKKFSFQQPVYIFVGNYRGEKRYIATYGQYQTRQQANQALRALQAVNPTIKPWIRAISVMQEMIITRNKATQ